MILDYLDINCESQYPSVQATISGAALKTVPKLSKNLVAYMLAVCRYVNCPFDSRAQGVAEAVASATLADLNKLATKPNVASLKRKLEEWYSEALKPLALRNAPCARNLCFNSCSFA